MKFPWSKQKHPYTPHSAPITNGILRNGKGAANSNRRRNNCEDLRVTFSLRRTGSSQIPLQALRVAMESTVDDSRPRRKVGISKTVWHNGGEKTERDELRRDKQRGQASLASIKESSRADIPSEVTAASVQSRDPPEESKKLGIPSEVVVSSESPGLHQKPRRRQSIDSNDPHTQLKDKETERKERRRDHQRGREHKGSITRRRKESIRTEIPCEVSVASMESFVSVEKPARRLSEMSADKIASVYGKYGSTGTIETADVSDISDEPRRSKTRTKLSYLLDEKIEAKMQTALEKPPRRLSEMSADKMASVYGKYQSTGTIQTANISDRSEKPRRSRTKLSSLLDEKIEAKMRRVMEESSEYDSACSA
eukprot:CAMPEP_0183704788 /NCGR_PEP_ID=MMETSP0737-20130205/2068_1 /TAXON_ID=385413 /ORGANISM="Thalassiosira miniscula, Strain CCMP1093" /LENGTH=366 /DNA_ID=CAMNT_0025931795 /DNA_START=79 /DNA_END=1179 /DNA_ORIENTATION=-